MRKREMNRMMRRGRALKRTAIEHGSKSSILLQSRSVSLNRFGYGMMFGDFNVWAGPNSGEILGR